MTSLEVILISLTTISLVSTGIMIWYVRAVLLRLYRFQEIHETASEQISSFSEHLNSVHELEMFYGDSTLQKLMKHSKELEDNLSVISQSLLFSYEEEYKEDNTYDPGDEAGQA
jgi:hypothetical protein